MWLTLILQNWKLLLLATVIALLTGLSGYQYLKIGRQRIQIDKLNLEKSNAIKATEELKNEYDQAFINARDNSITLVAEAEKNAVANYQRRFPNYGCGMRLPTPSTPGGSALESTGKSDAASGEHMATPDDFVRWCARDAARLNSFIQLCIDARCEIVKE